MLDQTFLGWKHTKTDFEAHLKCRHEECLPLSADTLKNTREAIKDSRECVRRRSDELLMAAGEGSILAGPVGTIALMLNGGEGSSQS